MKPMARALPRRWMRMLFIVEPMLTHHHCRCLWENARHRTCSSIQLGWIVKQAYTAVEQPCRRWRLRDDFVDIHSAYH